MHVRLYKGKQFTQQAEKNFYDFASDNFGWRDAKPTVINLKGNWTGAGAAYPRNEVDEQEFARYYASWGKDPSQAGTSAQYCRPQADQQTNTPIAVAKPKPPTPPQAQWNHNPQQQQRQTPWRNQSQRPQDKRMQ